MKYPLTSLLIGLLYLTINAQEYKEIKTVYSNILKENRAIQVSLPSGYFGNNNTYPVLYVLDGELIFNYATGLTDHLSFDYGYLPEVIVVGIPNTVRTRDLFVTLREGDGYEAFAQFFKDELIPYINNLYRTNHFDILYGWSAASGMCNYLMVTEPELIDAFILAGCGIGPKTAALIKTSITKGTFDNSVLYVNVEKDDPGRSGMIRFRDVMESIDPEGLKMKFEIIEHMNHVEVMPEGLKNGLKFIFSDYYIPESIILQGATAIQDYYHQLSGTYGYTTDIPVGATVESSSVLANHEKYDEAEKLLRFGSEIHPYSPVLFGALGEFYQTSSNKEKAMKYYKKALDLSTDDYVLFNKYQSLLNGLERQE